VKGRNLIASIGSGPVIIIGAHYDTRLWADNDPEPAKRRDPVMGANDAASGAAVLLELARVLGKGYQFTHEIRLVFLDAEDNGNIPGWADFSLGTYEYVKALDVKPEYVVILDMIGDTNLNIHYEGRSMESAPELVTGIWHVAETLGYTGFVASRKYTMIDDHTPFIDAGIKAIDIIDFDYPEWHTVSDLLDKISAQSLEQVGRTLQVWLEQTGVIR
jgi:Zn-dependent M28 family amino/carboxypeptidase